MRNRLSNPILCKAANAEFGRSIAIGAATRCGFAKVNGFSYQHPMYARRSSSFFARSRSLGEAGNPTSAKSSAGLAGRRFTSVAVHQTVVLDGWHEVLSNTENLSYAMRNVAFLD